MKPALKQTEPPPEDFPIADRHTPHLAAPPGGGTDSGLQQPLIKRFLTYFYNRFIRLHGSAEQIAWGSAVGLFVAMSPTLGFQMCIAVAIAAFFKINKVAAAAAVWVTNPATAPVIYWINYQLGAKLLGYPVHPFFFSNPSWESLWNSGKHVFMSLLIGGGIAGIALGAIAYIVTVNMIKTARKKAQRLRGKKASER
jgi:hypothetical protein